MVIYLLGKWHFETDDNADRQHKGGRKASYEFWTKVETMLYYALIGYIHYEAPVEK